MGQVLQVSGLTHLPSPQLPVHGPQSKGQVLQVSGLTHLPSPQEGGHLPQSVAQVLQFSPLAASHFLSPQ